MLRILKPDYIEQSENVVLIPDAPPPPPPVLEHDEQAALDTAAELSPEELLERERKQAERLIEHMLDKAREESGQLLEQARREADIMRQNARAEGYEAGKAEAGTKAQTAIDETRRLLDELKQGQNAFFKSYERELGALSIEIARKILGDAVNADPMAMADLARQAVAAVRGASYIEVELSDRLPTLIQTLTKEFARSPSLESVELTAVSAPPDSCTILTNDGVVDASVKAQLKSLAELFNFADPT